jgi:hypothetical protein
MDRINGRGRGMNAMKRIVVAVGLAAVMAVPAVAVSKPTKTDRTNAARECRSERGTTTATREAFRAKYGTNHNKKNAFGKCVSRRSRDEANERKAAKTNASKECSDERARGEEAFNEKYGTNKNKKNAFGKCVSGKAKKKEAEADQQDKRLFRAEHRAAKTCAAERKDIGRQDFADRYGTNHNKRNAFGKCVSKLARSK